jgi:hypothetical protein
LLPNVLQNVFGIRVARHARPDEPHEPLPHAGHDVGNVSFLIRAHEYRNLPN